MELERKKAGAIAASLAAILPAPSSSLAAGPILQRLAALLALLVLIWNLASLSPAGLRLQNAIAAPLQVLRLDQRWDSFALPPAGAQWWVAPGVRADGREVDALRPHQLLSFNRPSYLASEAESTRWRNWQQSLTEDARDSDRRAWALYLCRQWNQGRAADSPNVLRDFRLVEMFSSAGSSEKAARFEQRIRLRQDCVSEASAGTP